MISFILFCVTLYFIFDLKKRVEGIERSISNKQQNPETVMSAPQTSAENSTASTETFTQHTPAVSFMPQSMYGDGANPHTFAPAPVATENHFIEWLKEDFLMKVGGLFLLMALGWFVSFAFANNWIGPVGRITLGLCFGAALLVLGAFRIRKYEHQGAVFLVLGSTTILLTIAAARALYNFFTPASALGLIFFSVLFVTFMSLQYRRNSLALASLILASLAPHFILGFDNNITQQFVYLSMIVAGTLWIVYVTAWRNLTLAALVIVFLETLPYLGSYAEKTYVLLWVFLFVAIFFVANIVSILRVRGAALSAPHLFTAIGTALFLILWVFVVAPQEIQSLLFVFWMLVFSFGTYIAYRATDNRIPFFVYGITSLVLLASATVAELDGAVLVIALTLEVAVLTFCTELFRLEENAVKFAGFLFTIPAMLSITSISSSAWNRSVFHEDLFVLIVMGLSLMIVGLFIHERSMQFGRNGLEMAKTLILSGGVYGLVLLWLILHALFVEDTATMIALIVYTIIGLVMYKSGNDKNAAGIRTVGGILIGCVVVRLLLIDVWNMDLVGRIITFLAVGILLISTAFMGRKSKVEQQML